MRGGCLPICALMELGATMGGAYDGTILELRLLCVDG
jgi:hypothetical protein